MQARGRHAADPHFGAIDIERAAAWDQSTSSIREVLMAVVIEGEERIAAPVEKVWEALNDPEILKEAIPGCRSLERKSDT
ncbi:hypothetical protein A9K66_06980 [Mesorhizobium sp. AA23]|nr:hypothetical protein A9K66_06980 [Mesorhizobium sp. AA23]